MSCVNEFVEIYAFYVKEIGVDGFRIDTVKHVHHAFLGCLHGAAAQASRTGTSPAPAPLRGSL